jgi:hypothetical protein
MLLHMFAQGKYRALEGDEMEPMRTAMNEWVSPAIESISECVWQMLRSTEGNSRWDELPET